MTYSIVARDHETGELGVAVQTHYFQVGTLVPWARSGVGAVAAQARGPGAGGRGRGHVEVRYGPLGLDLMEAGYNAQQALAAIAGVDSFADWRQVAMVDAAGTVAAHTGARCVRAAGHRIGAGFSAQGNMMASDAVWEAIAAGFEAATGPLAERMLAGLEAGQAAGGDLRGQQSAAMLVVAGKPSGQPWLDRLVDIRVDDHPAPLVELRRLLRLRRAYTMLEEAHVALGAGDRQTGEELRRGILALAPEVSELTFWTALDAAAAGEVDYAASLLIGLVKREACWLEYMRRLPDSFWLDADLARALEARITQSVVSPGGKS